MAIDLELSSEQSGTPLSDSQLDSNFSAIETAVNSLTPLTETTFNTQLVLRLQKGTALTNEELDDNFIYLDGRANSLHLRVTELEDVTVPEAFADISSQLATKQPLHAKLTSLSAVSANGLLTINGDDVVPRTLVSNTSHIVVTNGSGSGGNPTIDVAPTVVTTTGAQTLTGKTISGASNTITNLSLSSSVTGILPVANGGTGSDTNTGARSNLNVLVKPVSNGIVAKTGTDSSVARVLASAGVGISIQNASGETGNPTIISNATSANTASTLVSRDGSGNFSAGTITASLVGSITGNAATVTNGVYVTGQYANPTWITSLAGSKVTNIPNSSLINSTITINGDSIPLGGSVSFETGGVPTDTPSTVVKRDSSGNFSANVITASLNGNATTATSAGSSFTATKLATPRTINGVAFDGTANITVADSTKLPISGGTLSNFLTLHADPTSNMHAVTKQYVDNTQLLITSGTMYLTSIVTNYGDVFPPNGYTMSDLKGFLPAFGSSTLATPSYSTNLLIAIDTSGSASSSSVYNGITYAQAYFAAAQAAKYLINFYVGKGDINVCLIEMSNTNTGKYKWTSPADALVRLNNPLTMADDGGTSGTIIAAYSSRPSDSAQSAVYFLSDCNHDLSVGSGLGGSEAVWTNFLSTNKIVSYGVCVDNGGTPSRLNQISYDGRTSTNTSGFRALGDADLPTATAPGLYNTGSINWSPLADRIRVELTNDSDVSNVAINWLAFWN